MSDLIQVEAKSVRQVFSRRSCREYRVPKFQRSFSWTKENVDDFWDDLDEAIERQRNHFFGSIVLQSDFRSSGDKYFIFDGQQRLTVVVALVGVIRHACTALLEDGIQIDAVRDDCETLIEKADHLLFHRDSGHLVLQLSQRDKAYFRGCISRDDFSGTYGRGTEFLRDYVFKNLTSKIARALDKCESVGAKVGYLKSLSDAILNRLHFVVIYVDKQFAASTLFETLNFRGTPLKVHDLFKSFLLSKALEQKRFAEVEQDWAFISDRIESRRLSFVEFLRVFWVARHGTIPEGSLYKLFKKDLEDEGSNSLFGRSHRSDTTASRYVSEIAKALKEYVKVTKPIKRDWHGDIQLVRSLEGISLSGGKESYPFLVALLGIPNRKFECDENELKRVKGHLIRAIEALSVRNHFTRTWSSNDMQKFYADAIREMYADPIAAIGTIVAKLKKMLPDRSLFEARFAEYEGQKKAFAMYLLHKIERSIAGRREPISTATDDVNLEHIMPRKVGRGWKHVARYHRQYVGRLGNLTLISRKLNVTNTSFAVKKRKYYSHSTVQMTQSLCQYEKWRKKEISNRQKEMAALASKVWGT